MTPQHYTHTVEPASRLPKEDQPAFWKGQIIKYFSRAGLKEGVPFEDDFAKGLHCVERYKECIGEQVVQVSTPEPKYRDLGPHTIPDGYRQLADDEVVEQGDLCSDVGHTTHPWTRARTSVGKRVIDTRNNLIFARPLETAKPKPEAKPAEPAHISKPIPSEKPLGVKSRIPDGYIRLKDGRLVPENDLDHEGIDSMMGHHHIPMLAIWF